MSQILFHAIYDGVYLFSKQFIYRIGRQTRIEIRLDDNTAVVIKLANDWRQRSRFWVIMLDIGRHTFALSYHFLPFEDNTFIQVGYPFPRGGNLVGIQPKHIFLFFG